MVGRVSGVLTTILWLLCGWLCGQPVQLAWDPSPDADVIGYNLYRSNRSGTGYQRLNSSLVKELTYSDLDAPSGETSYYVCTAVNAAGLESEYSNEVEYTVPAGGVTMPAGDLRLQLSEDTPGSVAVPSPGPNWRVLSVSAPSHGTATIAGMTLRYTPALNYHGSDSFRFTIADNAGSKRQGSVEVIVTPENDPPAARLDVLNLLPDQAAAFNPLQNDYDPDGDVLVLSSVDPPNLGSAEVENSGRIVYRPFPGAIGTDRFNYRVSDGNLNSIGLIEIRVNPLPQGQSHFLLPALNFETETGDPLFVGFALLNLGLNTDIVDFTAFDESGSMAGGVSETAVLLPKEQTALLGADLGITNGEVASVGLGPERPGLHGFFMVGDQALERLDGVGAKLNRETRLFLPFFECAPGLRTYVQVLNSGNDLESEVKVMGVDPGGFVVRRWDIKVKPRGSELLEVGQVCELVEEGEFYVEVVSSVPVMAIASSLGEDTIAMLAGQPERLVRSLVTPHVFRSNDGGETSVAVFNFGEVPVGLRLRVFDDVGAAIGDLTISVPSTTISLVQAEELLPPLRPDREQVAGSLLIETTSRRAEPILATVLFKGPRYRSSLPLAVEGLKESVFLQVAQATNGTVESGLGIFNPSTLRATITIAAYGADGRQTGERQILLDPKGRFVELLRSSGLFGEAFEQFEGYLWITSNVAVVSSLTYSDANGEFLAAVEPQAPHK